MSVNLLPPDNLNHYTPDEDELDEEIIATGGSSRLSIAAGLVLLLLVVGYAMIPKSQGQGLAVAPVVASASVQNPTVQPASVPLTGRIIDENGNPLVGATVLLRGTSRGTSTDAKGNYTLEVPAGENVLVYSYGGYEEEVVRTHSTQPINVTLAPSPNSGKRRRR